MCMGGVREPRHNHMSHISSTDISEEKEKMKYLLEIIERISKLYIKSSDIL